MIGKHTLARILCFIFGHRYEVWQVFSATSRRVVCDHCGGDWGMNDHVRAFVPWDGQLAEIYETMGIKIRKRLAHLTSDGRTP